MCQSHRSRTALPLPPGGDQPEAEPSELPLSSFRSLSSVCSPQNSNSVLEEDLGDSSRLPSFPSSERHRDTAAPTPAERPSTPAPIKRRSRMS